MARRPSLLWQGDSPGELAAHLHDEALVMAAPRLGDELVLEATPLLIEFHNRVLAMLGQDRPLLFYVLRENRKEPKNSAKGFPTRVGRQLPPNHDGRPSTPSSLHPLTTLTPSLWKSSEGLPATALPPPASDLWGMT